MAPSATTDHGAIAQSVNTPSSGSTNKVMTPTPPSSPAGSTTTTVAAPASSLNVYKHFASGLAGGTMSAIILQPADLLKTRVQQTQSSTLMKSVRAILAGPSPIQTLWRGAVPSAIRSGLGSGLYFTTLDMMRKAVARTRSHSSASSPSSSDATAIRQLTPSEKSSPLTNLVTGATARVFAGFVMMPITVIKVRYESSFYSYSSIAGAGGDIYRKEGMRGFFSGFGATAIRDAPYAGVYVSFYEAAKGILARAVAVRNARDGQPQQGEIKATTSTGINLASGLIAGASATAVTNPFDALKTRIQLFPDVYGNMWTAARKVVGEEGVRALFDGLGLRIGRKALSSALAWTAYEEGMRRWAKAAARKEEEKSLS